MAFFCYNRMSFLTIFFYDFAAFIIAAFAVLNAPRRSALRPTPLKMRSSLPLPPMPRSTRLQAPPLRKVQSMAIWRQLPSFYAHSFAFFGALICLVWSSCFCLPTWHIKPFFKKTARKGTKCNATTPSTPSRGSETTPSRGGARMTISNHRPTPLPAMTRTPVTETPRRSRGWRKNHDEKDMFASTVKVEVRTRKGRFVEARRSARILKYGSPMKTVKREP